jgi:hypothetical protein
MTILYSNIIFKTLDLHGETLDVAMYLVKNFINDNIKMKNEYIAIIHGNGEVLKNNLLKYLKKAKKIKEYNIDIYNSGQTLIKLDI